MTIIKTVVLDQMQMPQGRNVIGDFVMVLTENGREISRSKPHTINIPPDGDYAAILKANNDDIATRPGLQWPAIDSDEWRRFTDHCAIAHTPAVKAAYAAVKLNAMAEFATTVKK